MMVNALLVYPAYPDTFWSFKHALPLIKKKAAFPPLGLLTVAAMLPKSWDLRLVDLNTQPLKDTDLEWADYVLVSAMLVQRTSVKTVIERAKKMGKTVIAGGPAFTTSTSPMAGVDHFVLDESEVTLPVFLADLERGEAKSVYRSSEKPNLARTPAPRWDLIHISDYATMLIQYSRGCPFQCEFCDITVMNGRTQRVKSPEQVIHEFQLLFDTGWRGSVFIVDDNFIGNWRHAMELLPKLTQWQRSHGFPFQLLTEASVNLAELPQLLARMRDANFSKVFLGIETPSRESLRECRKFQNVGKNLIDAVHIVQSYGMQVMGGFIIGFDSDRPSVFRKQRAFIQQAGIPTAMVGLLTALPGTDLWRRLRTEGRITDDATGDNTDSTLNFTPKLPRELLQNGYRRLLQHLYSPRVYYRRVSIFLEHYRSSVRTRLTREDLGAFVRSLWYIGIRSPARFHFAWLLVKTTLTNIRALPIAVELAIYQLHFARVVARRNV